VAGGAGAASLGHGPAGGATAGGDRLTGQTGEVEAQLPQVAQDSPQVALLTSIPGIGRMRALLILLEIDGVERLPSAPPLARDAGLGPSTHSGGTRPLGFAQNPAQVGGATVRGALARKLLGRIYPRLKHPPPVDRSRWQPHGEPRSPLPKQGLRQGACAMDEDPTSRIADCTPERSTNTCLAGL